MSKPFTTIGAIIFLIVAAAHAYRLYAGFPVTVGAHDVPMMASWIGGVIALLFGIMMLVESRR
jgi:hypothetical protein